MTAKSNDFQSFYSHYQKAWNSCDPNQMKALLSPQLNARWVWHNNDEIEEWGYEEACQGWVQAYEQYEGQDPKWHFKILHITPTCENEVLAVFWVTFELNGKSTGAVNLFVNTFQKEVEEWRLVREYCESSMPESIVCT